MKRNRPWKFAVCAVVLCVVLAGCGSGGGAGGKGTNKPASSGSSETGGDTAAPGDGDVIKVGILHSLSGTMSISEVSVKDSELMAIQEINAKGGVLGKQLVPVMEDARRIGRLSREGKEADFRE